MTRRPSERRSVGRRKKARPLGNLRLMPSPATNPPVSELESPKLKMIGGFLQLDECAKCGVQSIELMARRKRILERGGESE